MHWIHWAKLSPGIYGILGMAAPLAAWLTLPAAAEPAWWEDRGVTTGSQQSNHSPATIGQAKWVALQASQTLQAVLPDVASQIDDDLTAGGSPILENGWAVSSGNLAVLRIGQLKALAHPFYNRLASAVGNGWMNEHLLARGLSASSGDPGVLDGDYLAADGVYYPWKLVQSPDNQSMANLGQLKLCFDLPLTEDSEIPPDRLPDLWEHAVVHANPPGGYWTHIGLINASNAAQAAAETGLGEPPIVDPPIVDPPIVDPPIDKSDWESAEWFPLTGNGTEDVATSQTRTFTIKKGKSRIVVVGIQSDEYPTYTDDPDWNDILEWTITPSVGNEVNGNVRVNDLHGEWQLADDEGTVLRGGLRRI